MPLTGRGEVKSDIFLGISGFFFTDLDVVPNFLLGTLERKLGKVTSCPILRNTTALFFLPSSLSYEDYFFFTLADREKQG